MALERIRKTNFKPDTLDKINRIIEIVEEYGDQKLTARQVYYQFVARGWLANVPANYKTLTNLITDARYAGLVDWDAIEDRGREVNKPSEWDSIGDLVDSALAAYRLPRWKDQKAYVELWVEKQALEGVLEPIARRYHVPLMVNKGYSSASAMKAAANRFIEACGFASKKYRAWSEAFNEEMFDYDEGTILYESAKKGAVKWINENTKGGVIYYLGDHDPSGKDMVRDIEDRLKEFGVLRLEVIHLGLTTAQVHQFNPPPNPAKLTDSRAKAYVAEFGDDSWELDALPPRELNRIVERALKGIINKPKMDAIIAQEELDKQQLQAAVAKLMKQRK